MALVEIDEQELLRLRRTGQTVNSMLSNKNARRKVLEALKDVNPEDPAVAELDRVDPVDASISELREANAALKKQIEDDKAEREKNFKLDAIKREQDAGFAELRSQRWTDDGIAKVKAVMEEKGILDVAIAAKWIESQMPPANPVMPGGSGGWNFMDNLASDADADLRKLIETKGENEPLLRKMTGEAINEVRGVTRR